jgi:predicted O-methyltransferase YrrM
VNRETFEAAGGRRCTLDDPRFQAVVRRLTEAARHDKRRMARVLARMLPAFARARLAGERTPMDRYYARLSDAPLPLGAEQATFAYLVARAVAARRAVEFGTSFGLSAAYLAAAVKDNGGGAVVGSEIMAEKAARARANLDEADLSRYVEIRVGDARATLADPGGSVDLVLLDGAKDLYVAVLKVLTPHLRPGAVVLADNVTAPLVRWAVAEYVAYVRAPGRGFRSVTLPFKHGLEYSVYMPDAPAV